MTIEGRGRDASGFTLIELMVVVLIIAILIAIAIPTFFGARTRAQNRAAQVDLRNALIVAETYYADAQDFDASAADLTAIEPDMVFDDIVGNATTTVIGIESTPADIVFVRRSATDTYFCIAKSEGAPGTMFGSSTVLTNIDSITECVGTSW